MFKDLSLGLIEHFWNSGSYTVRDMINLVLEGTITEEEFHEITRYNFKGVYNEEIGEDD